MIRSFRDGETDRIFARERSKKFGIDVQRAALRKLAILHAATRIDDLRIPPANRLEKLHGKRAGQYSIRINDQWRLCFRWDGGDAWEVEITDYH